MDRSSPGLSVQGILQARILEWVAMPFSKGSSRPRDQTHNSFSSCTGSDSLPLARPGKLMLHQIMSSQHIQTSDPIAAYTSLADGDCSHEIKRRLLLGRKVTTNLDSILKSTDITLLTNIYQVRYGYEL